jgi:hypothetical protein
LKGNECNPKNITDPNSEKICVNDLAADECPYDPGKLKQNYLVL